MATEKIEVRIRRTINLLRNMSIDSEDNDVTVELLSAELCLRKAIKYIKLIEKKELERKVSGR